MKFKIENTCYVAKGMSVTNQNFAVFEGSELWVDSEGSQS
jgi:hypothetical protein